MMPTAEELKRSIIELRVASTLRSWFGSDWSLRGDPRTVVDVSLPELQEFARTHGIPRGVLVEDRWSGDDQFVLKKQGEEWRVGFAERGEIRLIGIAVTKEAARDLVVGELYELFELAANPSCWKDGVPVGTPMSSASE